MRTKKIATTTPIDSHSSCWTRTTRSRTARRTRCARRPAAARSRHLLLDVIDHAPQVAPGDVALHHDAPLHVLPHHEVRTAIALDGRRRRRAESARRSGSRCSVARSRPGRWIRRGHIGRAAETRSALRGPGRRRVRRAPSAASRRPRQPEHHPCGQFRLHLHAQGRNLGLHLGRQIDHSSTCAIAAWTWCARRAASPDRRRRS